MIEHSGSRTTIGISHEPRIDIKIDKIVMRNTPVRPMEGKISNQDDKNGCSSVRSAPDPRFMHCIISTLLDLRSTPITRMLVHPA